MAINIHSVKENTRRKAINIALFSYTLILGTSLPIALSRCTANCYSCGSCGLYFGIVPVIMAVLMRNKIKRVWISFTGLFTGRNNTAVNK
jgi:hypothetical protein